LSGITEENTRNLSQDSEFPVCLEYEACVITTPQHLVTGEKSLNIVKKRRRRTTTNIRKKAGQ
jgi:hypothetical protein